MNMNYLYIVTRPSAGIVSRHRTLSGAKSSLARQISGSHRQGGYCQDRIEILDAKTGTYREVYQGHDDGIDPIFSPYQV